MSMLQRFILVLLCANTIACGFALRGSQALPEELSDVAIKASTQFAPLARTLKERLPVYQLNGALIDSSTQISSSPNATVIISMQPENLERRLLSMFSSGQVAEYELIYTIEYQVAFPEREVVSHTLIVAREYQEDPDRILAKSRELDIVIQEMRDEIADRMIRLLSSQYNLAPQLANG